jgi:hypothetical protein
MSLNINPQELVLNWMGSEAFIPVNKFTAHKIGLNKAIMLAETINQFKRWFSEGRLKDGMFYWTEEDCEEQTTFSKATQSRIFGDMEKMGLLQRHKRRVNKTDSKTTRFIELFFEEIAKTMFSDPEAKAERERIRKERKQKQKEYKREYDANKSAATYTVKNLVISPKFQNETSRSFKLILPEVSKRYFVFNKKELIIKNLPSTKNLKTSKTLNPSIYQDIEKIQVSEDIQNFLAKKHQTLTDRQINLSIIESFYNQNLVSNDRSFKAVLNRVLAYQLDNEQAFESYLRKALLKHADIETAEEQTAASSENGQSYADEQFERMARENQEKKSEKKHTFIPANDKDYANGIDLGIMLGQSKQQIIEDILAHDRLADPEELEMIYETLISEKQAI